MHQKVNVSLQFLEFFGLTAPKKACKMGTNSFQNGTKNGPKTAVPFRIFNFGTSSVPVPEISELVPEREQNFRSGPITVNSCYPLEKYGRKNIEIPYKLPFIASK